MYARKIVQKDYYRVLGVPTYASVGEIKKAFKKLAFQYHPDRTRGNRTAEERFKELSEAYRVLTDEQKRRSYDLTRPVQYRKPSTDSKRNGSPRGVRKTGVNWAEKDFLGDLFFEFGKKNGKFHSHSFEQVLYGSKGVFFAEGFTNDVHQDNAHANSSPPTPSGQNGTKASFPKSLFASVGKKLGDFFLKKWSNQSGKEGSRDLHFTLPVTIYEAIRGGEKWVSLKRGTITEKLLVKIPPGIKPGMKLRLKGKGKQGHPGMESGDLFFRIHVH